MNLKQSMLSVLCAGLFVFAACGEEDTKDETSSNTGAQNGNTTGTGAQGDGGATSGTGNSAASCLDESKLIPEIPAPGTTPLEYECDASDASPDACKASDCEYIASGGVRNIAKDCALGCRSYEADCDMLAKCNFDCVQAETKQKLLNAEGPGVSGPCATCYAEVAVCGQKKCLSECADDADSSDCIVCMYEAGCRKAFDVCSSLERKN